MMWLEREERGGGRGCTIDSAPPPPREIELIHGFIGSLRRVFHPLVIADHFTVTTVPAEDALAFLCVGHSYVKHRRHLS